MPLPLYGSGGRRLRISAATCPTSALSGPSIRICVGCGAVLFDSDTKFDAGCGWPSFSSAIEEGRVERVVDTSHGMRRVEVRCSNCGSHLGHVFEDGPEPTGERFCINSAAIDFDPAK